MIINKGLTQDSVIIGKFEPLIQHVREIEKEKEREIESNKKYPKNIFINMKTIDRPSP